MKNTDDPIVAMIEAHRRACVETRATFEHQSVVENEFVAGVRWIAANDAAGEALAVQDDLAVKLLEPGQRPSPAPPHSSPIMSML